MVHIKCSLLTSILIWVYLSSSMVWSIELVQLFFCSKDLVKSQTHPTLWLSMLLSPAPGWSHLVPASCCVANIHRVHWKQASSLVTLEEHLDSYMAAYFPSIAEHTVLLNLSSNLLGLLSLKPVPQTPKYNTKLSESVTGFAFSWVEVRGRQSSSPHHPQGDQIKLHSTLSKRKHGFRFGIFVSKLFSLYPRKEYWSECHNIYFCDILGHTLPNQPKWSNISLWNVGACALWFCSLLWRFKKNLKQKEAHVTPVWGICSSKAIK